MSLALFGKSALNPAVLHCGGRSSEHRERSQTTGPGWIPPANVVRAYHAWNDFLGPLLFLLKESNYTLALGLTFFQSTSTYDVRFNLMMAASTLIVLPVILLFFIFQRAFVSGLTVGSLK